MNKFAALLVLVFVSVPAMAEEFTLEEFFHIVDTTGVSAASCYESLEAVEIIFAKDSTSTQEQKDELIEHIDIFCSRAVYGQDVIEEHPELVKKLTKEKPETTELLDGVKAVNTVLHKVISFTGLNNFPRLKHTFKELGKKRMNV